MLTGRQTERVATPRELVLTPTPETKDAVRIVCWGARGSVPSPGPGTARYGGNTSCIEVRTDRRRLIFDAGTGIIPAGHSLATDAPGEPIEVFLTHFHWDHIQGLPFFMPLRDPAATIRIHATPPPNHRLSDLLAVQMGTPFFPVTLQEMPARIEYHELDRRGWVDGDLTVMPFPVRHPDHTSGLRITAAGTTVVYIPDNEPESESYRGTSWNDLVEFARRADILLHDAMFTRAEYDSRRGWGHGTFEQAVHFAQAAGTDRLLMFHHHPDRTDEQIDAILESVQTQSRIVGSSLEVAAAVEGQEIVVPARRAKP
jgi:phosphoribosyl 1,2-cyclic phosphodiesterase